MKRVEAPVPLESQEAHTSMQYMQARGLKFTHIKNETGIKDERGKIKNFRALMDWKDGVSAGFPDFAIILPSIGVLFIELKRASHKVSSVSKDQRSWIDALNTCPGVAAHIAYGSEKLAQIIEHYYPMRRQTAPSLPDDAL